MSQSAYAQFFDESTHLKYDTNYIRVYKDELTTRIYLARKQNGYTLSEGLFKPGLKFKTNDKMQLGLGYTYSFLTINLAIKPGFMNTDDDQYGESKSTDLSIQTAFRSYIFNVYLQWNEGHYISNPEDFYQVSLASADYPIRGDLRTNLIGFDVSYLFNSKRYSYKASFQQNEFQKRSAGTPIAGAEAYWMLSMADSSILPVSGEPAVNSPELAAYNQADLFNFGVKGGYAYTFVWGERLYVSVSSTLGLALGFQNIHDSKESYTISDGAAFGVTNNSKLAIGYNNNKYYVGVSYIRLALGQMVGSDNDWMIYSQSSIRFNVVRRFQLKRNIKILRPDLWIF